MMKAKAMKTQAVQRTLRNVMIVSVMFLLSGLLHVWLRTKVVVLSYEISSLKSELARLETSLYDAKLIRSRQLNPKNLEQEVLRSARQGVIFKEPEASQRIYLKY